MQLRSPAFGNTHTLNTNQIVRHTQGGELKVLYDPSWPQIELFQWEFQAIKTLEKDALIGYLIENAGAEIEIRDFENLTWSGIFKSPFTVTDVRGDGCFWDIVVEFEGRVV